MISNAERDYGKSFVRRLIYRAHPRLLRVLEKIGFHKKRQKWVIGFLKEPFSADDLKDFLIQAGFEHDILAWKDPGEVLSMRKLDKASFQYHIRLFTDNEIRGHYEYSPESNPIGHIFEVSFEERGEYFKGFLKNYLA